MQCDFKMRGNHTFFWYYYFAIVLFLTHFVYQGKGYFAKEIKVETQCFCQLEGKIDDCTCNVDTVDHFNNVKIYPRLSSLLMKDYFRFYKVNLKRDCPFWSDDSRCAMKFCSVEPCLDDIPPGIRGYSMKKNREKEKEHMKLKYSEAYNSGECDHDLDEELGYLNTTISEAAYEDFALWQAHDDAQDNFCTLPDEDGAAEYVDLLLNPERYTGYRGKSAHRIWRTIYLENCFRPEESNYGLFIKSSNINGMCLEKRVFYRVISGLHSSINIHLSANYLLSAKLGGLSHPGGEWGPNLAEFQKRFNPKTTCGEGPQWLRNLYFIYLLELRAIAKAAPYLELEDYYTGNEREDSCTKEAIMDFLSVVKSFPEHFNESSMFNGGDQAAKLKEEFRLHFRNVSQIMDCVGCDKCKLWGKLQIQGLGTALKILFSGKFDKLSSGNRNNLLFIGKKNFQLERSEIVALFNAFGRLSTSIHELEVFRNMIR
uniref:Ero1-like protein n=1 Tax=Clastoptera arizonana TaxID=38151 RepID=A0A1B6C188_9HEMI